MVRDRQKVLVAADFAAAFHAKKVFPVFIASEKLFPAFEPLFFRQRGLDPAAFQK